MLECPHQGNVFALTGEVAWGQALDKKAAAAAAEAFGQQLAVVNLVSPGKEKGRTRGLRRIQNVRKMTMRYSQEPCFMFWP